MIVVATEDFEVYHEVVSELRDRGTTFTTIEPGEQLPERTSIVLTGADDEIRVGSGGGDEDGHDRDRGDDEADEEIEIVRAEPGDPRRAVEEALARLRGGEGRTVIGIDPGERPGIAVLHGDVIVAVFQVPVDQVAEVVRSEAEGATDPVVRIGDGARLVGVRIINELDELRVELVDETGTTPYLGTGVRESGDVLAAVNIARLAGDPIDAREFEPTEGELQVIKDRAREQSAGNRAIPEGLARRVASGELSIDEALAKHRGDEA